MPEILRKKNAQDDKNEMVVRILSGCKGYQSPSLAREGFREG
jgi:hypothetical protein